MLKRAIPHICIMLALFIITYVILNEFNPSFFSRDFFKWTLVVSASPPSSIRGF